MNTVEVVPLGKFTLGSVELASIRKFSSDSQQISSLIGMLVHNRDPAPPAVVPAAKFKVVETLVKSKQVNTSTASGE